MPKYNKRKIEIYTQEEIQQLIKLSKGTDLELIIKLTLSLGLRRGELSALKWNKVDFDNLTVKIDENNVYVDKSISKNGFVTKSPKSESGNRVIVITAKLAEFLSKYHEQYQKNKGNLGKDFHDEGYVICQANGKPFTPGATTRKFTRFLERNNLPHMRFHDLRHINATLMLQEGVSAKVAQARLGHSTTAITLDIYSHVTKSLQADSAERIEGIIF